MAHTDITHRVIFTPSGLSGTVDDGTIILDAARRLGADLDTVCGGRGICGRCQVTPTLGRFDKFDVTVTESAVTAPGPMELDYRGARPLVEGRRLGCAAEITGDLVVDVPAESQVHRQVVRKDLDLDATVVDPCVSLLYIEIPEADQEEGRSVSSSVATAVAAQHGRPEPTIAPAVIGHLHDATVKGTATVAVDTGTGDVVGIWPGFVGAVHGVAVDIGSTTIAAHLCDLTDGSVLGSTGRMNPQIRFGEDLMSRVSYVMMNDGGTVELTAAVRSALDELIGDLVAGAGIDRSSVVEIVVVGNPIMHHLFLGIDPTPLGQAPFPLAVDTAVQVPAAIVGLDLPFGRCYVGPCVAGHVGADTAAAVLAQRPDTSDAVELIVDVGTNAEIVLGNRERLYAASSPTGPAFEGAQISSGQRATAGAIEGVRIDRATLEPRLKVIGVDVWSDDPGFVEAAAKVGVHGICGSGIIDVIAEMFLAGIVDANGVIRGALAERSDRVVPDDRTFSYVLWRDDDRTITVTQNDVRAIQLAKAALRAGIDLLVERAGHPEIASIGLAGAFGAHIDPVRAMVLGLVPDAPPATVTSVGNAAGVGAVQALLSRQARLDMERIVAEIEKVETATEDRFQELFVHAMAFPHAVSPSPHLAEVVTLPAVTDDPTPTPRRRRRGGR